MRIVTKVKNEELEIIKIYISLGFTITIEIFTVPEGYKSLANNFFPQHDELLGTGVHVVKENIEKQSHHLKWWLFIIFSYIRILLDT